MNRLRVLAVLAAACCVCAGIGTQGALAAPAGVGSSSSRSHDCPAGGSDRIIVRATGSDVATARLAVERAGARVIAVQPAIGTLVASLPCAAGAAEAALAALAAATSVAAVTPDTELAPQSLGTDATGQPGSMAAIADITGARDLWRLGITGKGIDIALIDTGVAPVAGLDGVGKLAMGPDLSIESQLDTLRHTDTFGHGTHMAGIMAGREGPAATGPEYAADTANFYGIAPDARLLSLKVGDHSGAVDVSQVIAAIDWVVQNRDRNGLNVKVLNLSYGTPSTQDPLLDPLSYAVETAMRNGIVVVSAAGNEGDTHEGLINPAHNSNVIAVGATDPKGTVTTADDTVASFSARAGGTVAPERKPDLVAPGVSVVSLRVPGSTVAEAHPGAAVGTLGIRGSGSSQAAAVVSGGVALLLQHRSWLAPMHIKSLLSKTAHPIPGTPKNAQGAGQLDLVAAAAEVYPGWATEVRGTGKGSLDAARGGVRLVDDGVELTGEVDLQGGAWDANYMGDMTNVTGTWSYNGTWNGNPWVGIGWYDAKSPGAVWDGRTWKGRTWKEFAWTGRTWKGRTWKELVWCEAVWTASGWQGGAWGPGVGLTTSATQLWATSHWN